MTHTDLHCRQRRRLRSDRLGDGRCYSPASCDARAVMRLTALYSTRYALTARTKRYGLAFALFGVRRPHLRGCLRRSQRTARCGSYLHNVRLVCKPDGISESMGPSRCKTTFPSVPALSGLTMCSHLDVGPSCLGRSKMKTRKAPRNWCLNWTGPLRTRVDLLTTLPWCPGPELLKTR